MIRILQGDCRDVLRTLPDNSVDSIVTDPPYGLTANKKGGSGAASVNLESPYGRARIGTGNGAGGFMGLKWDSDVPGVEVWAECLRVLKPGGYLLAFAGTRTQHRMAVRIEDAGFEIRDMIAWVYGSGFPKSLDVSKAIDKASGAEREVIGIDETKAAQQTRAVGTASYGDYACNDGAITAPATPEARQWQGWGTALKPALEPITVARKPLVGTVAENVLEWGTGGVNVDGCRVGMDDGTRNRPPAKPCGTYAQDAWTTNPENKKPFEADGLGRWPANLIHDGSDEVVAGFPGEADGSAARFFYCAKADSADRDAGLPRGMRNSHPTVKPTDLMRYLCRLVTPPGGTVLDPFMGSGSTLKAAELEGFAAIGIELNPAYVDIARLRIGADAPLLASVEVVA